MVTRREMFPLIAGASGIAAAASADAAGAAKLSEPELRRVSYRSQRTGKDRDYFVYLPRGFQQSKSWPVMLFLHGDGERGDARGELDYVLIHGPLNEAWIQNRDLPFVIISPQLDKFSRGEIGYIKNRTPAQIPKRLAPGAPPKREDERTARVGPAIAGLPANNELAFAPAGPPEGWSEMEAEVMAMVDATLRDFRGDPGRVYLTGLSYGGFGTWFLGAKYARKFAAIAPVVGYGYLDQAAAIAKAKLPVWCFAGGRDPAVPPQFFFAAMNELEKLGAENRFTIEADLGHFTWVRVYGGQDLYDWLLTHKR